MATIEIRDVLDNETGQTIFPRTHVNAVIGLKDSNFFEAVSDGNGGYSVKLKSEYIGLWAEGWISAGGVGSGSGGGSGGLITSVRSIDDLGTPIQNESLTETFSAKAIESIFEELGDFGVSLSLSRVASYFKDANGNYFLDANGNRIVVGGAGSSSLSLLNKSGRVLSSVELDLDMSNYASKSWVSQNFLTQETDPTVPSWAKATDPPSYSFEDLTSHPDTLEGYGITDGATSADLLAVSGRVDAIEGWFEVVTVNGESALHAKSGMAIYSDSWVAAGGIGSGSGGGVLSLYDLIEVLESTSPSTNDVFYFNGSKWTNAQLKTINSESIIGSGNIPISGGGSSVSISGVKTTGMKIADITIDGVTTSIKDGLVWGTYNDAAKTVSLTLNNQQYVLCVNGYSAGGGVSSESDPIFVASPAYGITSNDISAWNAKSDFSGAYSDLTGKPSFYSLTLNAGAFVSGTYTPTSGAGSFNVPTTLDHINDGTTRKLSDFVTLSTPQTIDGAKTFTTNPVTIGSDSGLSVNGASYIDIGDARLVYDSGANALHITRRSGGTSNLVGLFADGFVSAGGVGTQSTFSYVTLDSDQTIDGDKSFDGTVTFNGMLNVDCPSMFSVEAQFTDDITLSGALNGITIKTNGYGYGEISKSNRLYVQTNNSDLLLGSGSGKVIVGGHPGSTAIGSNKLYVAGNACFSGIIDDGYSSGHDVSIQDIVNRIVALENA